MTGTPVTLTDDAGRVRFEGLQQGGGGGSSSFDFYAVTLSPSTPDLVLTGVTVTTTNTGDLIFAGLSRPDADQWDGTTPTLYLVPSLAALGDNLLPSLGAGPDLANPAVQDSPYGGGTFWETPAQPIFYGNGPIRVIAGGNLLAMVDDGSGGPPGSTIGGGTLYVVILRAP